MRITLNESNADDYILFMCDMYWEYDELKDEGYVDIAILKGFATWNPISNKWESSPAN